MHRTGQTPLFIDGELWQAAVAYFGSAEAATQWFRTPHEALQGAPPGEYCTSHYSGDLTVGALLTTLKTSGQQHD